MEAKIQTRNGIEFAVRDLSLAEAGRHQMRLAEHEMPGLMAIREEYADEQPLAGARVAGSLHMTIQTAVLIETLVALGAAVVVGPTGTPEKPEGTPVFAWKGETLEDYWWCTMQLFDFGDGRGPNMIVDDGGDATLLVHKGVEFEAAGMVTPPAEDDHEEYRLILKTLSDSMETDKQRFTRIAADVRGVTEETTNGVARLYRLAREGKLLFPGINVNDSVTKSKFDNKYGIRHSLIDGINRGTDVMIAGKLAVVCGYGDVGKGAVESLRGQGARVVVTEIDPICALQAAMEGLPVVLLEDVVSDGDIL